MNIPSFLLIGTIIDEKETRKTGIGLIFIGILSLIISILILFDIIEQSNKNFPAYSLIIFGIIMIIIGEILRREYFK